MWTVGKVGTGLSADGQCLDGLTIDDIRSQIEVVLHNPRQIPPPAGRGTSLLPPR